MTTETGQTSSSALYNDGGEWDALWMRLRAANDGSKSVTLTPLELAVLVAEIGALMRRTGLAWDTLTMRLYRICDACFSTSDPPKPDCPVCRGAGYVPVNVDMHKVGVFFAQLTTAAIAREVRKQQGGADDGR